MYSLGQRFLLQESVSLRTITGSLNDVGAWTPPPADGTLQTLQGTVGLFFFPSRSSSIGVTIPAAANALSKASWGPFGSINPTEAVNALGGSIGDVSLQGSYRLWNDDAVAVAAWGGLMIPTGQAYGEPAGLTGSGLWNSQVGLTGIGQWGDWESVVNLGAQLPIASIAAQSGTFALGPTLLYQLQANYRLNSDWRFGLGISGYWGQMSPAGGAFTQPAGKFKVIPSVTYQWSAMHGLRLSLGVDPTMLGRNSMTDATLSASFFQFIQ